MGQPFKRPSLRDAARRGAEANRHARPAPSAPAGPGAGTEQVWAKCGHAVPMELYPDGRDKFRDSRRKHIADRDCPECRRKAHEERTRAEMEAARLRRLALPPGLEAGRRRGGPGTQADRLPHGSRFDVAYDAAAARWSGTLTVPAATGAEPAVFSAWGSGVFRLLRILDDMYRASPAAAAAGGAAPGSRTDNQSQG